MIELKRDELRFSFPEVHRDAQLTISFSRTLRIPDDDQVHWLPPELGKFPLRHVDDFAARVPEMWLQRGGVMLPMYQSEAMWLLFETRRPSPGRADAYPFAIKIATGKQCAVTGDAWREGLLREPQNYMVAPGQPWLDGFVVSEGIIRQFVAMPLGAGYSAEEQITGHAEHGGLQIAVYPMKANAYERLFPIHKRKPGRRARRVPSALSLTEECARACAAPDMALAPGGQMRQEIYKDRFKPADWDLNASSRCFVHLCNSMVWESITGSRPPHPAPTAKSYTQAGLPWFDYYNESATALDAQPALANLKSVVEISQEKGEIVLPENESVTPENVIVYRQGLKRGQVREGSF